MDKRRVLIIDDCRLSRSIAQDILTEAGFEVCVAVSAIEANPMIESNPPPDLILMDVVMPMLDGDRKVRRMKAREATRGIPVVLVSTKPIEELQGLASASGADGFLHKPLNRVALLNLIHRLI